MESHPISNSSSDTSTAEQEPAEVKMEMQEDVAPQVIIIARQSGATIYYLTGDENLVMKEGTRVWEREAVAMRPVAKHTNVPIPQISEDDSAFFGILGFLGMPRIPGV
jgi:hypothetical protein